MALQKSLTTKYGADFNEGYYRIRNFTTVRQMNGDVDVSVGVEVWINKSARDNLQEPIDYLVFNIHGTAKEAEL